VAVAVPQSARVEDAVEFGAVALFVERAHAVDSRFRLADDDVLSGGARMKLRRHQTLRAALADKANGTVQT
jgi:predicted ATPase